MLRIKNWNDTFETKDTRKRQRLGWIPVPTGNSSIGYVRLMKRGDRGLAAYGVFNALIIWSATMPRSLRGWLSRSDGSPISMEDLADQLRVSEKALVSAIDLLKSAEIGWIIEDPAHCVPGFAPDLPVSAPDLPASDRFVKGEGEGEVEGEGEGEGVSSIQDRPAKSELDEVVKAWNAIPGVRQVTKLTDSRRDKLKTRLRDGGWPWREAIAKLPIPGDGWQPDFDWFVNNDTNALKLVEGKYDWRAAKTPGPAQPQASKYKTLVPRGGAA